MQPHRLILASTALATLYACAPAPKPDEGGPPDRNAIALEDDWYGDSAERILYLDQNWSPGDSLWYYFTDQGSQLMPYNYFVSLEQTGSEAPFIDPHHMARFRYLPQKADSWNPDGLPVGFVRDGDHVGLTCSACHVGQINYRGTAMRIDGAPTPADMVGFLLELQEALRATSRDEAKFQRFAVKVLGDKDSDAARQTLRQDLNTVLNDLADYNLRNHSNTEYGFARVDAVGRIFNQVIRFTSGSENSLPANAPVSYPFLWDTPQHDWVQWPGLTPNAGAGALGRNAGEVVGVFGHVDVKKHKTEIGEFLGYPSTVKAMNLVEMEEWLRRLEAPRWPEAVFPEIDAAKAQAGAEIYKNTCAGCHHLIDPTDPKRQIRAQMISADVVGTDATEIVNLTTHIAPTGKLEGEPLPKEPRGPTAPMPRWR